MTGTFQRRLRHVHTGLAALLALASAAQPARADRVQLLVQAPYDFESGSWDLNLLDERPANRVLDQDLLIPYDRIEALARQRLAQELYTRQGTVQCSFVIDEGCPDVDWSVSFDHEFRFLQRGQPVLTPFGSPTDNGVRVSVDAQAHVKVTAHASAEPGGSVDVPLEVVIGLHASVAVKLYPVLDYQDFELELRKDGSNIDIEGLDDIAIPAGLILGTGIGIISGANPIVGGLLGAIVGGEAADIARDRLRDVINAKLTEAFQLANDTIRQQSESFRPDIASALHVLNGLQQRPIPGVGRTFAQLRDALGLELDVRSMHDIGLFRTVVTPRFANRPGAGALAGQLVLPRTFCAYQRLGSSLTGYWVEKSVQEVNADLAGASCAGMFADQLESRTYYGADPEQALASGDPQHHLRTWGGLGNVSLFDEPAIDAGNAFVCRYEVSGLPDAAIAELRPSRQSELDARLWDGRRTPEGPDLTNVRKRQFIWRAPGNVTLAVDHLGSPINSSALVLGSAGPSSVDDCPDIGGESSGGLQPELPPQVPSEGNCSFCEQPLAPGVIEALPPVRIREIQKLPVLRR
jgi:hypothetical protein